MKVNNIKSDDYISLDGNLDIVLDCSVVEALGMDTSIIEIRTDDGDLVESFAGYIKKSATIDAITNKVTLHCFLPNDNSSEVLNTLLQQMQAMQKEINELKGV